MLKNYVKKLAAGVMAAVMTLSVPTVVGAEEALLISPAPGAAVTELTLAEQLNYSRKDAVGAQSQGAVVLLEALRHLTEYRPQEAEYTYLTSEELVFSYDTAVTNSHVSTMIEGNTLTVTAYAESYTDTHGRTVRWVPTKVKVGTTEKALAASADGKSFEAVFGGLDTTALYTMTLTWRADLPLSGETIGELINFAYREATDMIAAEEQYTADLAAYEAAMVRYRADMQTFDEKNVVYQEYLKKLAAYTAELNAYNDYLAKVAAYEKGLADYAAYQTALATYQEAYQRYQEQLQSMQGQQEAYNQYQKYLAQIEQARAKLAVMDSIFVYDSDNHMMYATLMGDTVATVVSRKDELVAGGADGRDVDLAGEATERLKELLYRYQNCFDDADRYAWYQNYYTEVRDNFIQLYSCLYSLYQNPLVRTVLDMQGKLARYCQFVAQLYVISTGLDDSTSFDDAWKIQLSQYEWPSVYDLLDGSQIVADTNNYDPAGVEWPPYMAEVERPALPTAPQRPTEVQLPVKTWTQELTAPTNKPAEVAQPKQPVLSDYTAGEPQKPLATAELQAVMALVREGKLTERSTTVGDTTVGVETTLSRSVTLSGQPTVTFYDHDGKSIWDAVTVTEGSPVFYEGETPKRAADAQYTYTFSHWADAQGKEADFTSITEDTAFYAVYDRTVNRYRITWNIRGEQVVREYEYGAVPSYEEWQKTFSDDTYEYTFIGWSSAIRQVTGEATYTALFRVRALAEATYAVTYTIGERQVYRTYAYGETPSFDDFEKTYIDGDSYYVFSGWDKELKPVTEDVQFTAQFEKRWMVPSGENGETGAQVSETSRTLSAETDETVVHIAWAMARAKEMGLELSLTLGGARLTLDTAAVKALEGAETIRLAPAASEDGVGYLLSVRDAGGVEMKPDTELLLELPLTEGLAAREKLGAYIDGAPVAFTRSGSTVYLRPTAGGTVSILPAYRIEIAHEGNGALLLTGENTSVDRLAGETVTLEVFAEQGWRLLSLDIVAEDGRVVSMPEDHFVMPMGDVKVTAVFAPIEYTVVFMNGSREISRATYRYGDTVTPPADPTWEGEVAEGESYTFAGWSPVVVPVTENITYTAQFKQAALGDVGNTYRSGRNSNKLLTVFLPIAVGAAAVGGLAAYGIKRSRRGGGKGEKNG